MDEYRQIIFRYAQSDDVDEDFFLDTWQVKRQAIEERGFQIHRRELASEVMLRDIDQELEDKEAKLQITTDMTRRLFLEKQIDSLRKDVRRERIDLIKDTAKWSKERMQLLEEYQLATSIFEDKAKSRGEPFERAR